MTERRREYQREYRSRNREAVRIKRRHYKKACRLRPDFLERESLHQKLKYIKHREKILVSAKRYRLEHLDEKKRRDHDYYLRNSIAIRARVKEYQHANATALNEKKKARRNANPEPYRKFHRLYYRRNLEKSRGRARTHQAKRRAKTVSATVGDVNSLVAFYELVKTAPRLTCFWCKRLTKKSKRHVDHIIPLSKGGAHEVNNLCCSCSDCNLKKGTQMPNSFSQQGVLLFG